MPLKLFRGIFYFFLNIFLHLLRINKFPYLGKIITFVKVIMRIIAKRTLQNFWERFPNSKQQLLAWYQVFDKNNFANSNVIKSSFGTADFVGNNKVVFNICGNHYRLIVKINYDTQIVYILFIGTHSEYDNLKDIKNL
ncbi:mRNA-degrading endonuclease HigB of HigAB toxin-antitoxin module [Flavobacterium sp. 245]|nr:mRNA-degrading endonuclease HigB of HigAB toxin-antitoxin module [Flavobacterium sp. 245]